MLWIPLSYVPVKKWPVVSGQWSAKKLRNLITDHRPPTTAFTAIQLSKIESKRSGYSRASNIPGVTAPKKRVQGVSPCFRCFGSGNAAPAVLDHLFRAIL